MDDADFFPTTATTIGSLSLSPPLDDPMGTSDGVGHCPSNNEETTPTTILAVDEHSISDETSLTMEERLAQYKARKERQRETQQRKKATRRPRWSSTGSGSGTGVDGTAGNGRSSGGKGRSRSSSLGSCGDRSSRGSCRSSPGSRNSHEGGPGSRGRLSSSSSSSSSSSGSHARRSSRSSPSGTAPAAAAKATASGTPPLRPLSAATLASMRRRSGDVTGSSGSNGPPPLPTMGASSSSRKSTGTSLGRGGRGSGSIGTTGSGGKPPPAVRRRATLCAGGKDRSSAGARSSSSSSRSTSSAPRRRPLASIQTAAQNDGSNGQGSCSGGTSCNHASPVLGEPSAKRSALATAKKLLEGPTIGASGTGIGGRRQRSNAIVDDAMHHDINGNGDGNREDDGNDDDDDDDDDDAFVPPSFLSNNLSNSSPAAEHADWAHRSTKLTLASSSSDEDDGCGRASHGSRGSNDGSARRSAVLHFDDDGMDSPEALLPPPTPMGRVVVDTGNISDDDMDKGKDATAPKDKKRRKKNKKRRNTTLFVPPPSLAGDDALADEEEEEGREDEKKDEAMDDSKKSKEAIGTSNTQDGNTDEVDYQKLCKTYKDEHASLRFLIGILKLEKSDAESRLSQLSEAFETKSAQNKTMAADLTKLRRENASLKQAAADKQMQMDAMVTSLQAQMMQGLSAAVEKTKKLQGELEVMTAEKEKLQETVEELRAGNE